MMNELIAITSRSTVSCDEEFELDPHFNEVSNSDLDKFFQFDQQELETEADVPAFKEIPRNSELNILPLAAFNQAVKREQHAPLTTKTVLVEALTGQKNVNRKHQGLELSGIGYDKLTLNKVTLQNVRLPRSRLHTSLNTMPVEAKLNHLLGNAPMTVNTLPQQDVTNQVAVKKGHLTHELNGRLGMATVQPKTSLINGSGKRSVMNAKPLSSAANMAEHVIPPLTKNLAKSNSLLPKKNTRASNEAERVASPLAKNEVQSNSLLTKNNTSASNVAERVASSLTLNKTHLLHSQTLSRNGVNKAESKMAETVPQTRLPKMESVSNQVHSSVNSLTSITERSSSEVRNIPLSSINMFTEASKVTIERGLTVPSTVALQTLIPVAGMARTNYDLAPEMFWQYPQMNSYRVLFRNKYYLFEFVEHQMTNFMEEYNDRT
ncbi:hypothetical protein BS333_08430 [Vibrio azureus]|uniref:Uncharacterized protein n=1 Tax=Vibrio azureus NBRC 104587 TaxID=1219077 RepID=U3CAH8_9VIBR|nr:hypothetical protein [Vibrio azureus]AUI86410.1 hypothetical protein BS333_08430 [Vibrio azureus]GAD75388.1 hypothetical protein VAZ01S_024_00710 [Vibrio azureus NBRC 104587]